MYKGSEVFYNEAGGSLVRLKKEEVDEGGIAIDQAVIAGLCLVDEGWLILPYIYLHLNKKNINRWCFPWWAEEAFLLSKKWRKT